MLAGGEGPSLVMEKPAPQAHCPHATPLFIHLRPAAGSLQNPAKLEATAAVGKAGPHLVHPLP